LEVSVVAGVCCVYDDDEWLPVMVEACYPALDRLVFLVARHPWNGESSDNVRTCDAIAACCDPENKIAIVRGDWPTEAIQRNAGLEMCAAEGMKYCFVVDADEIYDPAALKLIMALALSRSEVDIWHVSLFTYWKSYRYRIDPIERYKPAILVKVGSSRFFENRVIQAGAVGVIPKQVAICHHMSYARTDDQVARKIARFSHARELRPHWFDQVWKRWDGEPELEDLHPVDPSKYKRAVRQEVRLYPPALKLRYERETAMMRK
jgi:hypothetical protein